MIENNREIYRQRYETFRHLDKLRWQMFQLLAAIASTSALVLRVSEYNVDWWFFLLLGISLVVIAISSDRISSGIRKNNIFLREAAQRVGDQGIPDISSHWRSLTHWIWKMVWLIGFLLIIHSILEYGELR
jgi:hypothetical protein